MNVLQFVASPLVVEALWETTKMFWQNGKFSYDRLGAVAFGELVAVGGGLDFMSTAGVPIKVPYVGMICTGLLISRGSNFMHDLIQSVNNIQQKNKMPEKK